MANNIINIEQTNEIAVAKLRANFPTLALFLPAAQALLQIRPVVR